MTDEIFRSPVTFVIKALLLGLLALLARHMVRRAARRREGALAGRIAPTGLARITGPLPADAAALASWGAVRAAPVSIDTRIMRPTLGIRLLVLAVLGVMIWMYGTGQLAMGLPSDQANWMGLGAIGAAGWSVFWVWTYELRWNRDEIILSQAGLSRRVVWWRDVVAVRDDAAHFYVLGLRQGGSVRVLKWLVGMQEFLASTAGTMARNADTDARTARG